MLPILSQSAVLVLAVLVSWGWTHSTLATYNLQLAAILIITYFVLHLAARSRRLFDLGSTLILVSITFLLIFSTGGLTSPLFFLLDFLLFALVLLFEPAQTAILAAFVILLFLGEQFLTDTGSPFTTLTLTNLLSLALITPLALLFGRRYLEVQQAAGKIQLLEEVSRKDQTDTLMWVATQARPDLIRVLDSLSQIIAANALPYSLQGRLKQTYQDLIALGRSANELELGVKKRSETM